MRTKFSIRDFGAGAVVGLVLGTSGLATAAIHYQGWQKLSQDFKIGYVTGYLDMSNIARNLEPGGYIDQRYPMAEAKALAWAAMIDQLYRDPEYQRYSINSMMQAVAAKLKEKHGARDPVERTRDRMALQMQAVEKQKAARAKAEAEGKVPPKIKHVEQPTKEVATSPKPKPARKWCRCDGKDPKAERARRRAARAEAQKAAKAADKPAAAKPAGAPAADKPAGTPSADKPATAPAPEKKPAAPARP